MKIDLDEDDAGTSGSESSVSHGNPRTSRNLAEKQRRDNLNTNIMAMGQLLPMTVGSRRMDKISTLRLAAAFLRAQYTLGHGSTAVSLSPRQLRQFDLEQYLVDQVVDNGGFFIVTNVLGKIVYIGRQVEQHLGHAQFQQTCLRSSCHDPVPRRSNDISTRILKRLILRAALARTT